MPGEHVCLRLAARADSPRLKTWRANFDAPGRTDGWIAGGLSNTFTDEAVPVEWDLADPATRERTCADVVSYVREHFIPWFALFDGVAGLIDRLGRERLPAFSGTQLSSSVEFAMCFGDAEKATDVYHQLIRDHDVDRSKVEARIARFRRDGIPDHFAGAYVDQIARLAITHGLGLPWRGD